MVDEDKAKETVEKIAKQIVSGPITISSIGPIKRLDTLDKIQNRLNFFSSLF